MMSAQLQQSIRRDRDTSATTATPETDASKPQTSVLGPLKNHAAESRSPFVRAHSDSLVAWQCLDHEAIGRAKAENKLIFLSIGFFASHYCHLTKQESFSNPKVASLLNEYFIPILIDREQRPDIDSIYMSYNQSLSGSGGWPLNVFLTPELEPVFSGTYWAAPGADDGLMSETNGVEKALDWLTVIEKVRTSWTEEESRVREEAKRMVVELGHFSGEGTLNHTGDASLPPGTSASQAGTRDPNIDFSSEVHGEVDLDQIEEAYARITRTFDPVFGGFGQEDKFLTPNKLSFMLRATRFPRVVQDVVDPNDCTYISTMGSHTLRRIVSGAVHDHIGGGFHRSSITRDWSLPSFEKMLTDNALLLGLFVDAWLMSAPGSDAEFASMIVEVAEYITSDTILSEIGGFFTSEVADSYNRRGDKVMRNGAYYLWTRKEFNTAVGDEQEAKVAAAYWDVQEHGNVDREHDPHDEFLNQNIIRIVKNHARLSKQFGISEVEIKRRVESAKEKLRAYRQRERLRPDVDTKIVTAYNGMTIAALARTATALSVTGNGLAWKGERYLNAAEKAAAFIKRRLWDNSKKTLHRVFSDGRADILAFAEDYAFLIEGLIELYEATANESWLEWADELQTTQIDLFYDHPHTVTATNARCGAFYSTMQDAPHTLLRIKDAMDTSQPSANAVSVSNLFRLGAILGDKKYAYLAKESVNAFGVEMLEHPNLFPGLLCGIVPWKLGGRQWTFVGDNPSELAIFRKSPRSTLFTIRYHKPGSWLSKRDPSLTKLGQEQGVFTSDGSPGSSEYRKINHDDINRLDPSHSASQS